VHAEILRAQPHLSSLPARVAAVRREGLTVIFDLVGLGADGGRRRDRWPLGTPPDTRYLDVTGQVASVDSEAFQEAWGAGGKKALHEPRDEEETRDLETVMPLFQLASCPADMRKTGRGGRADVQALLACMSRPFELDQVFRARGAGERRPFQSRDPALSAVAWELKARREHLRRLFATSTDLEDPALRLGCVRLRPWQAAVAAHCLWLLEGSVTSCKTLARRCGLGAHFDAVATLPRPICLVHAAPGKGKTLVAAAVALGRFAVCVATAACCRQWVREAGRLGARAVALEKGRECLSRARAEQGRSPQQLWIVPRTFLLRNASALADPTFFPAPDLLILDEAHLADKAMNSALSAWPRVPVLGLSGTLDREATGSRLAQCFNLDEDIVWSTVIDVPSDVCAGALPRANFRVHEVAISPLERGAYESALRMGAAPREVLRTLIFPPRNHPSRRAADYQREVWRSILDRLAEANDTFQEDVLALLVRCPAPAVLLEEIGHKLGETAVASLRQRLQASERPLSYHSLPESRTRLASLWTKRNGILGAYGYLSQQLVRLRELSAVECPVCFEEASAFDVACCGHAVCAACLPPLLASDAPCPVCRHAPPNWCSLANLCAAKGPGPSLTSSKIGATLALLRGRAVPTLIVCPAELLLAVHAEFLKENEQVGVLHGPPREQERTLLAWERGRLASLLCVPEVLGVDLPSSRRIIFLTTLITPTQFSQAAGRVLRQGNTACAQGEAVEVVMLACKDTEETRNADALAAFKRQAAAMSQPP